ncbi:bifunctional ADP-dependent NAD(P)H-hydrate dehydratase/NAD(P)H-hydrate epimerase [Alteromonas pelagimontana]|uniref:Bifunctional NAD(P)H-hydrate repair enzyme n=1 Tax=Alteromonas pelagimontana TaxID=1858656 RepID=A0A6M4MFE1_9ALTE|nr:bifunctional ADP-dependent NAD(P)H-hydrate dehydratase/NAD(P)H-hydrate epimerase [Alteromonas pelagimontana]QJR81380.1 bifunctional ADP-dependent NAD(P)H-hydrate dehydratase/NAD(P)H-hydrate epimerase [Alteromonas pelagimontana]
MLDTQLTTSLSYKLFRADQVRENERLAAEKSGCNMFTLMLRAGEAVFRQCQLLLPHAERYLVLVGHGNNAGDGYIAALQAKKAGKQVHVCAVEPQRKLEGDAGEAQKRWREGGGQVEAFSAAVLEDASLVIDALLGTGISSSIRNEFADIIDAVNAAEKPVVSVDVPSGLDANTGQSLGRCVEASVTVTFVGIKPGLTTGAGKQSCGTLVYEDLGIGRAFSELARSSATLLDIEQFRSMGPRDVHSHKGTYGRLLCVGGNKGTAGAIRLSSEAALRSGAGMVRVFVHEGSTVQVSAGRPELMVTDEKLEEALKWATCVVIGPGLGQDEWGEQVFTTVMKHCQAHPKPMVIDADALNLLGKQSTAYTINDCILTPHAGEAARLLGVSVEDVESERFNYARQCSQRYHATCVLKGAGTIIDNESKTWVCRHGNPGMATAGSGDVLSGILGALLAQGLDKDTASTYGVTLHGKAGDEVARLHGQRGMIASDLFDSVRVLINQ